MSVFRSIRPDKDSSPHVQCCATPQDNPNAPVPRNNRLWQAQRERQYGYKRELCQRRARYEIDGRPYCPTHAGMIALQERLAQEEPDPR